MGFTKQQAVRFARAVHAAEVNIDELTEAVDAGSAQASDPYDLAMIRRSIESSIGEDQFNEDLRKKLMASMVWTAIHTKFERRSAPARASKRPAYHRVLPATAKESSEAMDEMAASVRAMQKSMAAQQTASEEQSRALQAALLEQSRALRELIAQQIDKK